MSFKVASLRVTAKDLLRSPLVSVGVRDGLQILSACPRVIWLAVAPWLAQDANRSPADSNEDGNSIPAPCIARAERVRASLEEAIDLEPALEAAKARAADLVRTVHTYYSKFRHSRLNFTQRHCCW